PGFNKELDAVKSVAPAPDVHIESEVEVSADAAPSAGEGKPEKPASKLVLWLRGRGLILQARFRQFKAQAIVFVKTVPKDFALYLLAVIKRL
ncbi:hypothetical protein AAEH84_19990, partial [Shewanella indica]|uniref:hypothetical protein n=1 Tax=Shewanella indica TaxID=768528 RepID=UPI00313B584E